MIILIVCALPARTTDSRKEVILLMAAYLLSIFADVLRMAGHNGEELEEAVEGVAVAGR